MLILGVSGFQDVTRDPEVPTYAAASREPDAPLTFRYGAVPIQGFPLAMIGHDPAAVLLDGGRVVAAVAEERLTRLKHGMNLAGHTLLPRRAILECLRIAGRRPGEIDAVAHYCRFDPSAVAGRLARVGARFDLPERALLRREYSSAYARRLSPEIVRGQIEDILGTAIPAGRFHSVPHHLAHAAGAVHGSGFPDALVLTLDGYGEAESSLWGTADASGIDVAGVTPLPTSLGALYQAITAFLGFATFGDEYKVMGLSSYGDPERFRAAFESLIALGPRGSYSTAAFCRSDLNEWCVEAFGPAVDRGAFTPRSADVAAALQHRLEEAVLHALDHMRRARGGTRLCLSGGVALNARLNGAIVRTGWFHDLFVQPAAADDGAALGAALYVHRHLLGGGPPAPTRDLFWGPAAGDEAIRIALEATPGIRWERQSDICGSVAELLAEGRVVGWFQGSMEFGPRALGARSILADPRSLAVRDRVNAMVKGREMFRPFAPSVLAEEAATWFDMPDGLAAAPYMIVTFPVRPGFRDRVPAVVHVDGSSRVQTVAGLETPELDTGAGSEAARYRRLIEAFRDRTGVPLILNTSFNRAGEPIVCTPADAIGCFGRSGLDALAIGDYLAVPAPVSAEFSAPAPAVGAPA